MRGRKHVKDYLLKKLNDHAGILFVRNLLKEDIPFSPTNMKI
jgi:hypothetical protein